MFRNYYPDIHVPSVFNIDYQKLYQKGYRGIIFDLDNTLAVSYTHLEQTCIVGRASVKGKIRVSYFVRSGLGLLLNKSVRRTYRDVKNILDAR